jgi:hypothetical protein
MAWTLRMLLVGLAALSLASAGWGQNSDKLAVASPPKDYRWEKEASARGLGEKDIQLLRKNKFVITAERYKQVFQPYLGSRVPLFITTDSLLNGFHVLFEESVYRLEQAHARELPSTLEVLWKNLDRPPRPFKGDARLLAAARQRARVFLGTARSLLDAKALPDDRALRALIQEEIGRVTAAREVSKPAWLGKPDRGFPAIDYSRFHPRGFYSSWPALQGYFRAVSWLQAIPFRLDNDEELAAFFLLHRAGQRGDGRGGLRAEGLWGDYRLFLGAGDDWDLTEASTLPKEMTRKALAEVRKEYRDGARRKDVSQINDQLRFAPASGGEAEIAFRFLSAYRIPDAILFQRTTTGPQFRNRLHPDGLEVCAALRSSFARDRLAKLNPTLVKEIDRCRPLFAGSSLYGQYLKGLEVLMERTEPDAPALFRTEAWQAKTCQTALAGWAQMRHTWVLQGKTNANYPCDTRCPTGFVEPVPEFYARLGKLVRETREVLKQAGALAPTEWTERAGDLRAAQAVVAKARKKKRTFASLSREDKLLLAHFDPRLLRLLDSPRKIKDSDKVLSDLSELLAAYDKLGEVSPDEILNPFLGLDRNIVANGWDRLSRICRRLEILAHKQLRQVRFSDEENKFLKSYGTELAGIMLYGGNSYVSPWDDAPRVVDVFSIPTARKHLLVGIGRPQAIWVLYPVKGVEVLCRGAILPYHEFTHPDRLTDAGWRTLLGSASCPAPPAWVRPLMAEDKPKK